MFILCEEVNTNNSCISIALNLWLQFASTYAVVVSLNATVFKHQ